MDVQKETLPVGMWWRCGLSGPVELNVGGKNISANGGGRDFPSMPAIGPSV